MEWVVERQIWHIPGEGTTEHGSCLITVQLLVNRDGTWRSRAVHLADGRWVGREVDPSDHPHDPRWVTSVLGDVIEDWSRTYLGHSARRSEMTCPTCRAADLHVPWDQLDGSYLEWLSPEGPGAFVEVSCLSCGQSTTWNIRGDIPICHERT